MEYISNKIRTKYLKKCRKALRIFSFKCNKKILKTSKNIPKKHLKIWKFEGNLRANPRSEIRDLKIEISKKLNTNLTFCWTKLSNILETILKIFFKGCHKFHLCSSEGNLKVIWGSFGGWIGEEAGKITNITFRHERVLTIFFHRNIDNNIYIDEKWRKQKNWNFDFGNKIDFRFWDFEIFNFEISSYFHILRFFSKSSRFFRFSEFFKNVNIFSDFRFFWDFQIFWKFPDFFLSISRFFTFLNFQKFRIFQPNKLKNIGNM